MKKALTVLLALALCLSLFASIAPAALADDASTTYTVTVNLGENTMLAEKSGALVQTVAAGSAIEDIHITTPEETRRRIRRSTLPTRKSLSSCTWILNGAHTQPAAFHTAMKTVSV